MMLRRIGVAGVVLLMLVTMAGCGGPSKADLERRLDQFSLPSKYTPAQHYTKHAPADSENNYVERVFGAPSGADVCVGLERAFRAWVKGKIHVLRDGVNGVVGIGCEFSSTDHDEGLIVQEAKSNPSESGLLRVDLYVSGDGF